MRVGWGAHTFLLSEHSMSITSPSLWTEGISTSLPFDPVILLQRGAECPCPVRVTAVVHLCFVILELDSLCAVSALYF